MRKIHVDYRGAALNCQSAGLLAKRIACENPMLEPGMISRGRDGVSGTSPDFDGANPSGRPTGEACGKPDGGPDDQY